MGLNKQAENLEDAAKTTLRRKFIALSTSIRKEQC